MSFVHRRLSYFLLVVSMGAVIPSPPLHAQQVESSRPEKSEVGKDGTVHLPAFAVPLSAYMSEEAKRAFIDLARNPLRIDWTLPISTVRDEYDRFLQPKLDLIRTKYAVHIAPKTIGGVPTMIVTPQDGVPPRNRARVLLNLHGGGFFSGAGVGALGESIPIAALSKIEVITIDYRMAPEHKFPAASEDVAAVYREVLKRYKPQNIGIFGCSAGGMLSAMAVAWFQKVNLPRPGAIGILGAGAFGNFMGDPAASGTWGGDSAYTSLPLVGGMPRPLHPGPANTTHYGLAYLSEADPSSPLVSPAMSAEVLAKFPPTLLITGTRAIDMSAAVQTHRLINRAGAEAHLHMLDGMGHCFYADSSLPESKEAYDVIVRFFDRHLGPIAGDSSKARK